MELTLRHSIPGRVRLHVPELRHRSLLAEATLSWLREQDAITGARINYDCASLIIEYDPVHADAMQRMLDPLSSLSLDDWEVFLGLPPQAKEIGAPGSGPDAAWPVKRPDPHPGVLVLPTVSLGLALLANPLAMYCRLSPRPPCR
jgi:Heavy metal associated domain 2